MEKVRDGYKMTELGEIPVEWNIEYLENIAQRLSGHTPDKKVDEYWNGDIPWISLKDTKRLDKRYIRDTTDYTTEEGIRNSSAVMLPKGTVVLSRDATVGKVGITDKKMATSQHFINYVCGEKLYNLYLYYDFCNRKTLFERIGVGSTIKTIGLSFFKSLNIILPSVKEQQKIANILSTVDDKIENTDNLIEKTKELKKGLMQKLLTKGIGHSRFKDTEIGRIPEEWEIVTIGEICEIGRGRVISKKEIETNIGIYPVYSSQTTNNGCMGYISSYDFEGEYVTWTTDGVNAGTTFYREGKFNCTNVCGTLKLKDNQINPQFFSLVLNNFTDKYVVRNGNPKLMNNIMAIIKIPISNNLEEQNKISKLIFSVDDHILQYESKKEKLQELKKGLMQKLLTGKVRVKV